MSFYVDHYVRLRNATFRLLCHGVRYDVSGARAKAAELGHRKDAIKVELDDKCKVWDIEKQENVTYHLYSRTSHNSPKLLKLLARRKALEEEKKAIPKDQKAERKAKLTEVKEADALVKLCRGDGSDKVIEVGVGLSDARIVAFFYNVLGCAPHKKKNKQTGKISLTCDDVALKKISQARPELDAITRLILEHRKCNKLLGYLDEALVDSDGRMRSLYKPFGTQTGRLSSSENPFGTGTNAQNFDRSLKYLLIPDAG